MDADFFEKPILKSPYAYPGQRWDLDEDGQPTNHIVPARRRSALITPVPKLRKPALREDGEEGPGGDGLPKQRPNNPSRYSAKTETNDGTLMANTETNNTDLVRAEILWKSADALRGQLDAIWGIKANLGLRSHLTPDSRTLSADAKKSDSPRCR